jgi:glycosyltransferase involved in cell wall biosynthesis
LVAREIFIAGSLCNAEALHAKCDGGHIATPVVPLCRQRDPGKNSTIRAMKSLVSIGMPVFNEAACIDEAINSLLSQSYQNIELIVSDNASTDGTYDIVLSYAARDSRIKLSRNTKNVGALGNFEYVRDLARGEYFMWAGAHDRWHPSFIDKLLAVLDGDPSAVLAYPLTMSIDREGRELGLMSDRIDTRSLARVDRFRKLVLELVACNMLHGVFRRRAVADLPIKVIWGTDILLLAEVSLRGSFAQLPEALFFRRMVREEAFGSDEYKRRFWTTLDPAQAERKSSLSMAGMIRELRNALILVALKYPGLNAMERLRALKAILSRFHDVNPVPVKLAYSVVRIARAAGR